MAGGVKDSVMAEDLRLKGVELSEGEVDGAPDDTSENSALPSFLGVEFRGVIFCCSTGLSCTGDSLAHIWRFVLIVNWCTLDG